MARILIIEADPNLSRAIVLILEMATHQTLCATDGLTGCALALEQGPDFIFCEIKLPHLDGYSVLSKLRHESATAQTPIVLMTTHLAKRDMEKGLQLGANGFLLKPFTDTELLHQVQSRLGN